MDGDVTVIEATSIVEYLALHHPGPAPLLPSDPAGAQLVRMLDRVFDNYVMHNMNRVVWAHIVGGGAPDTGEENGGKEGLQRAYRWLEDWLGRSQLPPHISLVTCAAAPSLFLCGLGRTYSQRSRSPRQVARRTRRATRSGALYR